jgi:hypothetical protein
MICESVREWPVNWQHPPVEIDGAYLQSSVIFPSGKASWGFEVLLVQCI